MHTNIGIISHSVTRNVGLLLVALLLCVLTVSEAAGQSDQCCLEAFKSCAACKDDPDPQKRTENITYSGSCMTMGYYGQYANSANASEKLKACQRCIEQKCAAPSIAPAPAPPPATASCFDSDPAMVSLNRSMHLNFAVDQWRQQPDDVAHILMRNLKRKVDLLGECKAITHEHLTFLLAQVSFLPKEQSGKRPHPQDPGVTLLREPGVPDTPDWEPYNLRRHVEWAKAQSRSAVLEEIQRRMAFRMLYNVEWPDEAFANMSVAIAEWYHEAMKKRDKASSGQGSTGNSGAFFVKVAMRQNTPIEATVAVRPRQYASSPIIVDYSNPNGSGRDYVIIVQPGRAGTGPHGSVNKEFAWQIDPSRSERKSQIGYAIFPPLDGGFEARYISVDAGGNGATAGSAQSGNASSAGGSPGRPLTSDMLIQPTKSVFAVNEPITIDYYNPKGSGWDWVVIVNPNSTAQARGPFSSIDERYGKRFDNNDNSPKERNGTYTFDGLPEGEYEARYIAWYFEGMAGANRVLGPVRFRVGNQVSASPPPGPGPGTNPPGAVNPAKDLTGLWKNPGGNAIYRVRQIGTKLVWGIDAVAMGSWANVFQGQISGNTIDGVWEDLPGSPTIGGGRMLLRIESDCRFVRVSSVNPYGADVWVKKDSMCDVVGLKQRSNPTGTKTASTTTKAAPGSPAKTTPKVEEIPDYRGRTSTATAPTNKPNKPAPIVEEIPEDNTPKVAANTPARKPGNKPPVVEEIPETPTTTAANRPAPRSGRKPPVVEEIPESASPNVASNRPRANPPQVEEIPETAASNQPASTGKASSSSGGNNKPKDKPKKEKKPRDPNKPDFWTRLGGAINEAITQQPQQQPGTPAGQPQQQDGQCRGGSYWLGTPTPESWKLGTPGAGVRVPWSTPIGATGDTIRLYRAGTDQLETWGSLPENSNACGLSWSLYPSAAGYYDAYLYQGNKTPVAGPVRITVYQ